MSNKFLNGITTYGDIELKNGRINFPNSSISEDKNGIYINTTIDGANEIETGISLVSNGVAEYINAESHNVFSKTVGLPKCIINDIVYFDGKYVAATFSWTNQAYGIYYSYDGQHWQPSTLSTGRIQRLCVCDTEHGQILLAAYFAKGFKVSKDGINWTTTNTADASFDVSGKWGSVAFGNGLIVAGDDNGVYDGTTGTTTINKENALVYSTLTSAADGTFNAGSWTRVNIDGKGIHEVAFINNTWFVGTTSGLYITSSPAATFSTWRKVLAGSAVFSIIFSEEANAYFIGTGDCVFKSTDLQSFTEVCGAADIIASGLVARTLACHDKFVIVGTEDGLQGLISDNYGEAGSWKRFAGFDENPTKANYKRIKFINGTFFLGNGSDADMDRCPESPIMFFDIDKVIATTADVERANKLTFAAIEQIEEAKSGLEDSIAEAISTKTDKSDVYTKSEIDSQNTAFLKKESSGIQTVSSDLALTGYVLIDNLAIDELNIESLSATSNVALSGGLTVTNGLVADSIKIGNDDVALAKNIPGIATSTVAGIAKYDGKGVTIESDGTVNLKLRTNHSGVEFENGGLYVQTSTNAHPTTGTVAPVATDTAGKLVVPDATSSAKGGVKLASSLDDTGAVSVTTASQVKTALAGKANSTHSHTTSEVDGLSEAIAAAAENKADKATTLAGYGITDAYTKSEIDSKNVEFLKKESSGIQTVSSDLALTGYVLIDNLAIDELEIESLTASSKVTLSGGLDVAGGLVADSIKVGNDAVALAKNIPNVSSFITKDVNNLTNYETKNVAEGKYALKSEISNVYKYVGSVDIYSALPTTGQKTGDVYNIVNADETNGIAAGDNVAWTGSAWDKLGGSVDLSGFVKAASFETQSIKGPLSLYPNGYNEYHSPHINIAGDEHGPGASASIELVGADGFGSPTLKLQLFNDSTIKYTSVYFDQYDELVAKQHSLKLPTDVTSGTIATLSHIPDVSGKADKSTTLSGYGIVNAYTKNEVDEHFALKSSVEALDPANTKLVIDGSKIVDGAGASVFVYITAETDWTLDTSSISSWGVTGGFGTIPTSGTGKSFFVIEFPENTGSAREGTIILTVGDEKYKATFTQLVPVKVPENIASTAADNVFTKTNTFGASVTFNSNVDFNTCNGTLKIENSSDLESFGFKITKDGETRNIILPTKSGTVAVTEDHYTKTESDSKFLHLNDTGVVQVSGNYDKISFVDNARVDLDITTGAVIVGNGIADTAYKFNSIVYNGNIINLPASSGTLALTSDIPDISGKADKATTLAGYGITNAYTKTEVDGKFITKDVNNLTNYETKTVAEAKYALKEEIPEVPTSAKYEIPAKTPSSNKIVWTITLDEEPDVAPIMQVFNKNGDVVYANITYVAGVITVVINSATACAEGDYYIIVSGQTGNSGYRTKVISNADFAQAALDNKIDLNTIYYIV